MLPCKKKILIQNKHKKPYDMVRCVFSDFSIFLFHIEITRLDD